MILFQIFGRIMGFLKRIFSKNFTLRKGEGEILRKENLELLQLLTLGKVHKIFLAKICVFNECNFQKFFQFFFVRAVLENWENAQKCFFLRKKWLILGKNE